MMSGPVVTLCDMIEHARTLLADKIGTSAQPSTSLALLQQAAQGDTLYLWGDAELTLYANAAVDQVARRTRCLSDRGTIAGVTQFALTSLGDPEIAIDQRLLQITRVTFENKALRPIGARDLDLASCDWATDTGEPRRFLVDDSARTLRLFPAQSVDGTVRLEVVHRPLTQMVAASDEPEIPQHMRADAVLWMCHLAYLKNDADTALPGASAGFSALFDQRFGRDPGEFSLLRELMASVRPRPRVYFT